MLSVCLAWGVDFQILFIIGVVVAVVELFFDFHVSKIGLIEYNDLISTEKHTHSYPYSLRVSREIFDRNKRENVTNCYCTKNVR